MAEQQQPTAPASAAPEAFVAGFPPPPFYFTDFDACEAHCAEGAESGHLGFCRQPPPLPRDCIVSSFGVVVGSEAPQMLLDEDTRLFHPPEAKGSSSAQGEAGALLRSHFQRLFGEYVSQCMEFLDNLARGLTGFEEPLRKALRSHRNLLQVLSLLRVRQAQEQLLERLQLQLRRRRQAADNLRRALSLALEELQFAQGLLKSE